MGPIAQLGERRVRNAEVGSSILLRSTIILIGLTLFFLQSHPGRRHGENQKPDCQDEPQGLISPIGKQYSAECRSQSAASEQAKTDQGRGKPLIFRSDVEGVCRQIRIEETRGIFCLWKRGRLHAMRRQAAWQEMRRSCSGYLTSVTGTSARWITLVVTDPMISVLIDPMPRVPMMMLSHSISLA